MMLYPPVADLVDKIGSRYQLVERVARRARSISAPAGGRPSPLEKKDASTPREIQTVVIIDATINQRMNIGNTLFKEKLFPVLSSVFFFLA